MTRREVLLCEDGPAQAADGGQTGKNGEQNKSAAEKLREELKKDLHDWDFKRESLDFLKKHYRGAELLTKRKTNLVVEIADEYKPGVNDGRTYRYVPQVFHEHPV